MKNNILSFLRKDIQNLESYVSGISVWDSSRKNEGDTMKLNANENPYGFSPAVSKALQTECFFNYYPSSQYKKLRNVLGKYIGLNSKNIAVGAGSDKLIDEFLRLFLEPKDEVINCPPTFGMYEVFTKLNRGIINNVYRNKDFSLDTKNIIKQSKRNKVKVIFICNPNNPTGNLTTQKEIIIILKTGKLVVVDEAYFEFSKKTVAPLLKKYNNLVILRTLSKWAGLAGLRIGYAIASPILIEFITRIKSPFDINRAGEIAAIATLSDRKFPIKFINKIIIERERMYNELLAITNIVVYSSYGNFLFLQVKNDFVYKKIQNTFKEKNILLRYFKSEILGNGIRITIGTKSQNNVVLSVFREVIYE